ncbi:MAG TPA: hypothetical protein GX529_08770 [Firmicutes bacterium]|nr:hypothetical protein [Candidatus Fermentithermobacillaceae bacterium]
MKKITLKIDDMVLDAELNDSPTANAVWEALPISARGNLWGDEIYFEIPVNVTFADKKAVVDKGDLGYWEPGRAFCIFYGPTPASRGGEIRPASPVNVIGRVKGNVEQLKDLSRPPQVVIERIDT